MAAQIRHPAYVQLGDAIRDARVRKGLSQEQLGDALPNRVHAKTVSKWERGLATPRGQLTALEAVLGVRLTNRPATPQDPAAMTNDELTAAIMRLVAEAARRLNSEDAALTTLDAEQVLARGWKATRRGGADAEDSGPIADAR